LDSSWSGNFSLFFHCNLRQDLVFLTLLIGGELVDACTAWGDAPTDVRSATTRPCCLRKVAIAVFNGLYDNDVCRCLYSLLMFQSIINPSRMGKQRKKTTSTAFLVFLFIIGRSAACWSSLFVLCLFSYMKIRYKMSSACVS
jgi:hypothetical protein